MRNWKRCAVLALVLVLCASLLSGCGREEDGMALAVSVGAAPESLDPIYATAEGDQTILAHLYENLMRVTVEVSGGTAVINGLAKSVSQEANADGTVTWTFKLRGAKWSDGRSVKAEDFVYAWRRLADPASGSPYASLLSVVVGYDDVRATGDTSLLQVSAKNDSTLIVVLTGVYDWFLTEVCTSPATAPLREDIVTTLRDAAVARNKEAERSTGQAGTEKWWSQPDKLVTNGPYQVAAVAADGLTLTAAERYHSDITGPRRLTFRYADTAEEAQALFDEKAVDLIWPLTDARMTELAESEAWTPVTELGTYTLLFNCGVFTDPLVRQAFSLAIDRNALAEAAGVTARPASGLVPMGVPDSEEMDFRTHSGDLLVGDPETYAERVSQAKTLLEQAGYDSGAGLGTLEYLYVDTPATAAVAQLLAEQWRQTLGARVEPRAVTEKELRAALREGTYTLAATEALPLSNDAECFLMQWTSDSVDNFVRYQNSAYDTLMSIIAAAEDGAARMGCLHDAEELLLEDSALSPLYTTDTDWTVRDTITGACRDARGWFVFTGVTPRGK